MLSLAHGRRDSQASQASQASNPCATCCLGYPMGTGAKETRKPRVAEAGGACEQGRGWPEVGGKGGGQGPGLWMPFTN